MRGPASGASAGLEAAVSYGSGAPAREAVWFEVRTDLRGDLVSTGDPFLVLFAPLAASLGAVPLGIPVYWI